MKHYVVFPGNAYQSLWQRRTSGKYQWISWPSIKGISNHSIFKTTHYFRFLTEYLQKFVIVLRIVSINIMLEKISHVDCVRFHLSKFYYEYFLFYQRFITNIFILYKLYYEYFYFIKALLRIFSLYQSFITNDFYFIKAVLRIFLFYFYLIKILLRISENVKIQFWHLQIYD